MPQHRILRKTEPELRERELREKELREQRVVHLKWDEENAHRPRNCFRSSDELADHLRSHPRDHHPIACHHLLNQVISVYYYYRYFGIIWYC
jgi:hypothetical protein